MIGIGASPVVSYANMKPPFYLAEDDATVILLNVKDEAPSAYAKPPLLALLLVNYEFVKVTELCYNLNAPPLKAALSVY